MSETNAMRDATHIIQEGSLLLHWGELDAACFKRAHVWCEYYDPAELDQIIAWGVSTAWIDEQIIVPLEGNNTSAWYAPDGDQPMARCEIMAISADFCLGDIQATGFLTIVGGEITSGCLFSDGRPDFILSLADVLDEHNHAELNRLAERHGLSWEQLVPVRYETRGNNPFGISTGILDIPTSLATTAPRDEP